MISKGPMMSRKLIRCLVSYALIMATMNVDSVSGFVSPLHSAHDGRRSLDWLSSHSIAAPRPRRWDSWQLGTNISCCKIICKLCSPGYNVMRVNPSSVSRYRLHLYVLHLLENDAELGHVSLSIRIGVVRIRHDLPRSWWIRWSASLFQAAVFGVLVSLLFMLTLPCAVIVMCRQTDYQVHARTSWKLDDCSRRGTKIHGSHQSLKYKYNCHI